MAESHSIPQGYSIGLARTDEVALLPAIEEASANLFPLEDIPLELRENSGLPLSFFEQARLAQRLWVARALDPAMPVGFGAAILLDAGAHLHQLSVLPAHGRRGLGRALVLEIARWARKEDFASLTLTTFRHLAFNGPFYASLGFEPIPVAHQGREIRAALAREAEQGLDPGTRIAMRLERARFPDSP
jgi:GNAT superfamily N-acetyltransferase